MVTLWVHLNNSMSVYLNQGAAVVVPVPAGCKVEARTLASHSKSLNPTATSPRKQLHVRKTSCAAAGKALSVRASCNPRGQSSVIDAAPVAADTSTWRVEPAFLTTSASKELHLIREFGDHVQDTVAVVLVEDNAVERSTEGPLGSEPGSLGSSSWENDDSSGSRSSVRCGSDRRKQRSFFSRPDMIRWRLLVEGVRSPEGPESTWTRSMRVSHQIQDVVLLVESLGLDSSKLLADYPLLSACTVENVRAVVWFLEACQLRRRDVVRVLSQNPQLLGRSVEATFLPVVAFLLTEVGLRERDLGKVVTRCSRLLTTSVDDRLRPTLRFLQSLGFTRMATVVTNNATLLASSIDNRLVPKMEFLEGLGLSNAEAVQALIRFPAIFNYSVDQNLQPKYRFLVEDMGRGLDDLRAFPQYFGYSLEYRIRPRFQFLKERGLFLPLPDLLKPTDEVFYARFQHETMHSSTSSKVSSSVC